MPSIYLEGFKDVMDRVNNSIFQKKEILFILVTFNMTIYSNFGQQNKYLKDQSSFMASMVEIMI